MQLRTCAFAFTLAFGIAPTARGAVDDGAAPAAKVEIRGARYDRDRHDTASTVTIAHDALLRQGDRSLADALKRLPGITIGDAPNGRGTEIRMRGLGNGYTQILVNGVAAPPGFSIDSLAPDLIERIDVIRAASAELGTQGIAGTINIVLRTAASARREFKASVASRNGKLAPEASVDIAGKQGDSTYTVAASLVRTRQVTAVVEDESRTGADGTPNLRRRTPQRLSSIGDVLTASPRLNWTLANGDAMSYQGYARLGRFAIDTRADETALIGAHSDYPATDRRFESQAATFTSDIGWMRQLDGGARLEAKLGGSYSRHASDFWFAPSVGGGAGPALRHVDSAIGEDGYRLNAKYSVPAAASHALAFGWELSHAARRQTRDESVLSPAGALLDTIDASYDGAIDHAAMYAQDEWTVDANLSLSAGVRLDSLRTAVGDTGQVPLRRHTKVASPILQAMVKLAANRTVRLGLTRTYKAPAMFDLIPRRYTVDNNNGPTNPDTRGNPALRPELAWGIDAAYHHYLGKDGMVGVSAFARRIDDVTVQRLVQDDIGWVATPSNMGRASAKGIALEARYTLGATELRANLARNWSRIGAVPGPHNRIDAQEPVSANLGVDHRVRGTRLALGASFNYVGGGPSRDSAYTADHASPQRDLGAYGVWTWSERTRVRLAAGNLLQRDKVTERRYENGASVRRTSLTETTYASVRLTLEHGFKR